MEKKNKKIMESLKLLKKKLGNENIRLMGEDTEKYSYDTISTGIYGLDEILGNGGIVLGRIYELYGPEASGKTTIALHIIENFQKKNKNCIYIDAEHSVDPDYWLKIGINIDNLLISQPNSGEEAFTIIEHVIKSKKISLIVVDSVAALIPKSEIDGNIEDNNIGLQARLMSKALRKITPLLSKNNCSIIFINQLRANIKMFMAKSEITPGGRALKFYSSVRIEVRRTERIMKKNNVVGSKVIIKIVKNKISVPFKKKIFKLIYGAGIKKDEDFVETAIINKQIEQRGPFYFINNEKVAQGKEALFKYIKNNPKVIKEILE